MLAEKMREENVWRNSFAEVDIRFAEFVDWLNTQPQDTKDAVTIAMHLGNAFQTKFGPLPTTEMDHQVLKRVEDAQDRLSVDFLYQS